MTVGEIDCTVIHKDGARVGVRVDRADPTICISYDLAAALTADPAPGVRLDAGRLTIAAMNGTRCYRVRRTPTAGVDSGLHMVADRVETPRMERSAAGTGGRA